MSTNNNLTIKKAEEAEKRELEAVQPADINSVIEQINKGGIRASFDNEGNFNGVNGGEYYQIPYQKEDGSFKTFAGKTKEEAEEHLERYLKEGTEGDLKLHKLVYINTNGEIVGEEDLWAIPCDCVGENALKLQADIKAAQKTAKANGIHLFSRVYMAHFYAETEAKNLEEIVASDENLYILDYEDKVIRDIEFNIVADLNDLTSNLNKKDIKTLLIKKLERYIKKQYIKMMNNF